MNNEKTEREVIAGFVCCMLVCRAQSDKMFSQQSALGKAHEELRLLREQLESRQAQQSVIEAEISRQVRHAPRAVHTAARKLQQQPMQPMCILGL
jgi:hypothetical protein